MFLELVDSFYCGMVNSCPTVNKFVVRLLAFFKLSTDTLKLLAMDHNVSPDTFFM